MLYLIVMTDDNLREHWGDHSLRQAEAKDKITASAMRHVVFDGFSQQAIRTAAIDCDIDENLALSLFPDPEADLIAWHSMLADSNTIEAFWTNYNPEDLRIHERIKTLVMLRFQQNTEDREAIRIASRKLMHPRHSALSLRLLFRTCDKIWRAAGDTSTDWNFYSKRTLLGLVYTSTLPVWLNDNSEDLSDTEAYLMRRLQNVLEFGKMTSKIRPNAEKCARGFTHPLRFLKAFAENKSKTPII